MDKTTFMQILESALLSYDGMGMTELLQYGIPEKQARAGIKLCNFLQEQTV